jgi:hypothetical protein
VDLISKTTEYDIPEPSAENDGVEAVEDMFTSEWSSTPSE